jgi:FkbM family methyltransferase
MIDFKHRYPDARVIGVEMDASNYQLASRNIRGLPKVELVHAAVWIADGRVAYDPTTSSDAFSAQVPSEQQRDMATVSAVTIQSLFTRCAIVHASFVKMDIEGAEKCLFEDGNLDWLYRVDQISIELHGSIDPAFIKQCLTNHGMNVTDSNRHWSTVLGWRGTAP